MKIKISEKDTYPVLERTFSGEDEIHFGAHLFPSREIEIADGCAGFSDLEMALLECCHMGSVSPFGVLYLKIKFC